MRTSAISALLVLLTIALALSGASAQIVGGPCFGDDGFNVGCCNIPTPTLPNFPQLTSGATYGCILNCSLEAQFNATVALSAPNFVFCDLALINLTVTGGAGGPSFSGLLIAKYARTWMETNTAGVQRQVWRFLVNGDMTYAPSPVIAAGPCPIPLSAQPPLNLPVHMVGSIDYARNCGPTGTVNPWVIALNLSHVTGCLNHASFSQRPLVGPAANPNRNYVLVAPANFIFGPAPEPNGPLVAESVRSAALVPAAPFYQCYGEAHVANLGGVNTLFSNCYGCAPSPVVNPPLWKHQAINGGVNCGPLAVIYPFNTIAVAPVFPTGMVTLCLGTYVGFNPNQFPVGKSISVSYGLMQYDDPCLPNDFPFGIFTGVGTTGGDPAFLFTPSIGGVAGLNEFLDLQTMEVVSPAGTLVPGIGAIFLPRKVFNLNTL